MKPVLIGEISIGVFFFTIRVFGVARLPGSVWARTSFPSTHCIEVELTPECGVGFLAHEAVHCGVRIAETIEIGINRTTDEVLAYLVGYIVTEMERIFKEWNTSAQRAT